MNDWSRNELAAYNALEQARSGIHTSTILKNLGHYSQSVVDTAAAASSSTKKKDVGKKKKKGR